MLFQTVGAYSAITIDSVKTTPSTCANNGTITVYAQSGSSMLYAIISGPNLRPQQNSDEFASLPSGTYTIQVMNLGNDTSTVTATITGNYTSPTFSPILTNPECPGAASGMIIGNPANAGTPPYTWVLTNLTTNTTTTQSSDTFNDLAAGSYSLREYDSCGNFATYSATLSTASDSFSIISVVNGLIPCDSVQLTITLFVLNGHYAPPYTIQIQDPNGTYSHIIAGLGYTGTGVNPHFYENVGNVGYGDYINVTITDACGRSVHVNNTVADFYIGINFVALADSCTLKYYADFYLTPDTGQHNVNITDFPDPVTVIVSNPTTGAVIDTIISNDTSTHYSEFAYSEALVSNQDYTIKLIDGCGNVHIETYAWPPTPPPTSTFNIADISCMDSTSAVGIQWQNTFFSDPTFVLLSGPGHIGSTAPHYVYRDTIIYPQTYPCTGNTNGYFIELTNLAAGTYYYRVFDSCGNTLTDSFVITPQDLHIDHFTATFEKGCPGQNVIAVTTDAYSTSTLSGPSVSTNLIVPADTLRNLDYGTYIATFTYLQSTYEHPVNLNPVCQLIRDTIIIPPYVAPEVSYANQINCHGTVYIVFEPDSATGIPPYKYEILSGPQTTGIQSSNTFTLTQPGAYVARISDSCGYANTFDFTVDTLSIAEVVKAGASCQGYSATLTCQYSPYATDIWQLPGGGTYTGDSLVINPITTADFGTYNVEKIVSINGCTDTFHTAYVFTGDTVTQTTASICPGQSIVFGGISRTAAGLYYDTIATSSCDSVVALTLTIRGAIYDSVGQTICAGQSVTVGVHTYSSVGIYHDTFVTAGCDSIHILNLQVTPYKTGSTSSVICPGAGLAFGGHTLTQAGTYYDTLPTTGCDSIVTLTLSIRGPLYDSVSQTICEGTSVAVGAHSYTTTGIYRDTIATAGCDSVYVLNLHVTPYSTGTAAVTICPGQSFVFGSRTLTLAGTYYDTMPTTGCDSIVTLTLSIRGPLYDSVSQTICEGTSVTVGVHSYTTTGIYRDTIATSGCDSVYVLNLHVTPYSRGSAATNICPGSAYLFGAQTLTQAGTYYDTLATSGCDSIVTLTLSIRGPLYDSVVRHICLGQSVTVGANSYSTTGIYRDTIATAGCDSIYVLNLIVDPFKTGATSTVICPGSGLLFGSQILTQAGVYYDTLPTSGCDSIVTLTLSIRGPLYDSVSENICPGQSVTVGIHTYTSTGLYRDTIATGGCDSIHVLNLNVGSLHYGAVSQVICPGQSYLFGGIPRSAAGLYYDTIPTSACDSIVTLTLSIRGPLYDSVVQTICAGQSIQVGVRTYGNTGIYRDTIPTSGCDSFYVVNLQVLPYIRSSLSANICPGQNFVYGSNSYTATGTYEDTVTASVGCDTVITIHLTVLTPVQHTKDTTGICAMTYNSQVYTSDATLTDTIASVLGCDSVYQSVQIIIRPPVDTVINNAACIYAGQSYTIGGQAFTAPGTYSDTLRTVAGGCDSLITNTDLRVITPLYVHQRLDSCFSATIAGVTYTRDTVIGDTILSDCGLDSIIGVDTLHFFDPSITIITAAQLPIVSGNPVRLYISPAGNYYNIVWSPDSAISSIFAPSPTVSPINNTTYYVTAEDSNHCPVSAEILITVSGADLPDFLIPTAFSPNGDGLNDIYRPILKSEVVEVLDFVIYDRWGVKVFDKNLTGTFGWDGTYKDQKQPIGVYVYYITVKGIAGNVINQSGNVTLIR